MNPKIRKILDRMISAGSHSPMYKFAKEIEEIIEQSTREADDANDFFLLLDAIRRKYRRAITERDEAAAERDRNKAPETPFEIHNKVDAEIIRITGPCRIDGHAFPQGGEWIVTHPRPDEMGIARLYQYPDRMLMIERLFHPTTGISLPDVKPL